MLQEHISAHLDGAVTLCCCIHLPLDTVEGDGRQTVLMSTIDDLDDFHSHGCVLLLMLLLLLVKSSSLQHQQQVAKDRWYSSCRHGSPTHRLPNRVITLRCTVVLWDIEAGVVSA
jgi:hypothetical protein